MMQHTNPCFIQFVLHGEHLVVFPVLRKEKRASNAVRVCIEVFRVNFKNTVLLLTRWPK